MAKQGTERDISENPAINAKEIKQEKAKLKQEKKQQKKEVKERAKEIALKEAALEVESEGGGVSVVLVTAVIVLVWLGILALLIRLDVGNFGSNVLAPILKDVPVINKILPKSETIESPDGEEYGGYTSLKEAVDQIRVLELELEAAQGSTASDAETVAELKAEVERLKTFENNQIEFQRIKNEFYQEVVYSDKGPGVEEYTKYYESMDPATAEYLYQQAIAEQEADQKILDFVKTYTAMKPAEAAAVFESMADSLDLVAEILMAMSAEERGAIMGVMDPAMAAKITKIMNPGR